MSSAEQIAPGLWRRELDEGLDRIGTKEFVEFPGTFAEYVAKELGVENRWDSEGDYFDRRSL